MDYALYIMFYSFSFFLMLSLWEDSVGQQEAVIDKVSLHEPVQYFRQELWLAIEESSQFYCNFILERKMKDERRIDRHRI